ncbi:MAG: cytochrome c biogenesis CcdA family protein [Chloroflexi bacterium]|nr:cytochrome c biogenesis CcdA family protein [Chloroflexota bacterium]
MTLAVAFLGGLVSCLSPCVIPVIPVFVSNLAGGAAHGPLGPGAGFAPTARRRAAGFLLGFAGVFVALWVSLGLIGFALFDAVPFARQVAGVAIIGLGVATFAGWQPALSVGRWGGAATFGGSFLLGAGIAVGWMPCIGPTLGAILTLAAASSTVWAGAALLVAYALGMAVPILAIGLGLTRLRPLTRALMRHHRAFQAASGALIVGVGVLVVTNAFGRLAGLVPWPF